MTPEEGIRYILKEVLSSASPLVDDPLYLEPVRVHPGTQQGHLLLLHPLINVGGRGPALVPALDVRGQVCVGGMLHAPLLADVVPQGLMLVHINLIVKKNVAEKFGLAHEIQCFDARTSCLP